MTRDILDKSFYLDSSTPQLAKSLLGKYIVRNINNQCLIGKIVETEAYLSHDPACHASNGRSKRTAPMFMEGGISYVYMIYGMYYCFNVVSRSKGVGEAVLIRAIEPIKGVDLMYVNRGGKKKITKIENLSNGPGKLCQALQIDKELNKIPVYNDSELYIVDGDSFPDKDIVETTRIGISRGQDLPLRYYVKGNGFVSKF